MMEGITLQTSNLVTQTIKTLLNSSFFLPTDVNIAASTPSTIIILTIIVLLVSLPLNIYVLWLLVTDVKNGLISEFASLNLCVCELIVCLNTMLSIFSIILLNNQNTQLIRFNMFLCVLHNISRAFFQCCVCVERYVAVIHPFIFLKYKPPRYRTVLSVLTWILALGLSVISPFLPLRRVLYFILLPGYLLVFSIKILCSIAVLMALRTPGPGEKLGVKDAESNHVKKKAFWVIVIILLFMFITYCPIMVLMLMYDSLSNTQKSDCLVVISYFVIFAGFLQPLLYLHRVGKLPFIPDL